MAHSSELIWFLVQPWVREEDVALAAKRYYEASHAALVRRHNGPARARVLRALVRSDCHLVIPRWLARPVAPRKIVRNGRVHASEGHWLLDHAQASAAHKCAGLLEDRGYASGKGPKTRGGRQGKWKAWI